MSAKLVIGATLGLGAVTLGSVYLLGYTGGMPSCRFLSADNDAKTTYTSGYANNYLKYLVGVTKPTDHQEDSNDLWWEWVFANRYQNEKASFTDGFANLTSGSKNGNSIKQACGNAYKGTIEDRTPKQIKYTKDSTSTIYKEDDFWKLCSPSNTKILSIKESNNNSTYSGNMYGKTYEAQLVSELENHWFWGFQQGAYDSAENTEKTLDESSVKDWCTKTYKETNGQSESNTPKETNLFKWCSLKGEKTS